VRRRGARREVTRSRAAVAVRRREVGREHARHRGAHVTGSVVHESRGRDHGPLGRHLACGGRGSCGSLCDGRVDPAHVEGVHLVVQPRGRRRALQDLGWLRRRAAVDVPWVELVLVEEAGWPRLVAHLLALRGAPFTRGVILLAVRHVAKRDLRGR
jgi:hypothetical protein